MKAISKAKQLIDDTRLFVHARKQAYVFALSDDENTRALLADLSNFCRAERSTFHKDVRVSAMLEGRREVYLRIMDHLNLSSDELMQKYGGRS